MRIIFLRANSQLSKDWRVLRTESYTLQTSRAAVNSLGLLHTHAVYWLFFLCSSYL